MYYRPVLTFILGCVLVSTVQFFVFGTIAVVSTVLFIKVFSLWKCMFNISTICVYECTGSISRCLNTSMYNIC